MPNIEVVCARIDANTDKLSTQVRTLALGVLAFSGGLLVSALTGTATNVPKLPAWLLARLFYIGAFAILALAVDLAQYCFMYWYLRSFQKTFDKELENLKKENPSLDIKAISRDYNEEDCRFIFGRVCFVTKVVLLFVSVLWLIVDAYVLLHQGGQ